MLVRVEKSDMPGTPHHMLPGRCHAHLGCPLFVPYPPHTGSCVPWAKSPVIVGNGSHPQIDAQAASEGPGPSMYPEAAKKEIRNVIAI